MYKKDVKIFKGRVWFWYQSKVVGPLKWRENWNYRLYNNCITKKKTKITNEKVRKLKDAIHIWSENMTHCQVLTC